MRLPEIHSAAELAFELRPPNTTSDNSPKFLWFERFIFQRLHDPGETLIRDHKEYKVISHTIKKDGDLGLIILMCELVVDRTPKPK